MANPVTHILIPMFLVETYRRYFAKKKFSRWYVFLAGLMGAAPDFDLIYAWLLSGYFDLSYHRNFTHSLFIPLILFIAGAAIYALHKNKIFQKNIWQISYTCLFVAGIGIASHTIMDGIDGLNFWFYPFNWYIDLPNLILNKYRAAILDGALMLAWLLYDEELLNDIKNFLRRMIKRNKK